MNCVGIDVSKGKSTIAVMRPFGEVVVSPFEVCHTVNELSELARQLKSLDGETRVVMESTGNYHAPVAWLLHDAGFYVSVVNAMLVHDYGNNSLRRAKTDKKDAVKLANYGLDHWLTLPRYVPEEDTRLMLKTCYRQYQQYSKVQTMLKNNLISLLDTAFPNANRLFTSPPRADGSEKWVDFVATFWHCECVCGLSEKAFTAKYQKWCKKHGYNFSEDKALDIYASAFAHFGVMPKTDTAKLLVEQAISQLRATSAALAALKQKMQSLAASLPEYPVVMEMFGVGPTLGPQLMAEIGDVRRFHSKKALVAFAGIDAPPYQSGQIDVRSRSISKRGSASLRRTLFLVMGVLLQSPLICSSYRTNEKQQTLYNNKVSQYLEKGYSQTEAEAEAGKWVAVPGTSEHQTGLAVDIVDINYQLLDEKQEETEVQKWLMKNSYRYGFILRYPSDKSDITGIYYEPWHYRYVGKETAKEIYEQGICFEEYLDTLK